MNNDSFPNWYVLYTKSRHEKFVEDGLLKKNIAAFTPKMFLRRKWSDRIKIIEEPLFKSYCFAKFSLNDKLGVLTQRGVVTIVNFNGQYVPIPEAVINSFKLLMENKIMLDPCPYIKEGSMVTIKKGPLRGLEGFVTEKRHNNMTLVVSVDVITASAQCILDLDCVELA